MIIKFPKVMIDSDQSLQICSGKNYTQTIFIELAPMMLLPHAFFTVSVIFY